MNLIQQGKSAIFNTDQKLFCSVCKKQAKIAIETDNGVMACYDCFIFNMLLIFPLRDDGDFLKIRMVVDVLFDSRNEEALKERAALTLKLRFKIFKKDNFRCVFCGKDSKETKLEVDHKIPISKGGKTEITNLQTLCFNCNRGKGDDV